MVAFSMSLALGAGAASVACSDTDPKYGPPEAIRGRQIDYGIEAPAPEPTAEGGTTATKTPQDLFNDLYATIQGVGEGSKCTPCHAPAGTGVTFFIGTGAADAYTIFKTKGYQDITKPNSFYTKGSHTGPALTPAQQTLTKAWATAETAGGTGGGTTTPTDAGGD